MAPDQRMTAVDAQFLWMSAKVPNDEFLLYAFDAGDCSGAIERVRRRASACPALTVRVDDRNPLAYPRWVPADVADDAIARHEPADLSWDGCLAAVAGLVADQVDPRRTPWRLHVFGAVVGIPGVAGTGTVAVLQVPHALADGARSAALAAWLFGRTEPVPEVPAGRAGCFVWRAAQAARAHRQLVRDIGDGSLPPGLRPRPPLATNARPTGARSVRTLVRNRFQLRGPTVTLSVLGAVSTALSTLLGDGANALAAEVPMSKPGARQANNHFGNVSVGLYPDLAPDARAERIAAELTAGRRRLAHPATVRADRAFAAVPAALLRWGVSQFDADARPAQVSGNTVVSSVNRGPADLRFGDARVVLTAGYPALSPAMGLTHGVHGIGDTVAVSVHAAASALADIDEYVRLLDDAL